MSEGEKEKVKERARYAFETDSDDSEEEILGRIVDENGVEHVLKARRICTLGAPSVSPEERTGETRSHQMKMNRNGCYTNVMSLKCSCWGTSRDESIPVDPLITLRRLLAVVHHNQHLQLRYFKG